MCDAVLLMLPAGSVPPYERSPPSRSAPLDSSRWAKQSLLGLQYATTQIPQFGELNDQILMSLTQNSRRMHVTTYTRYKDHLVTAQ